MVSDQTESTAPEVGAKVLDCLDDRQELALGDSVVALSLVEATAMVRDHTFDSIVIHLLQAGPNTNPGGGVGGYDKFSIGAGVLEDGVHAESANKVRHRCLSFRFLRLGRDINSRFGEIDQWRRQHVEISDVIAVVPGEAQE